MKSWIHMFAMSVVKYKGELRDYHLNLQKIKILKKN